MRKLKFFTSFLSAVLLITSVKADVSLSAESAIVMEASTGRVVYEKDADTRRGMASTTKIMTALCAIEAAELTEVITVAKEAEGVEGSSVYLKAGDRLTLSDLLDALMLESANDAATAIAVGVSGSVEAFAELMNKKANELGLRDTHFTNPHGLSDSEHYTTARDLARLAAAAMENPVFRQTVSKQTGQISLGDSTRFLRNHNKMLRIYEGACGVKTGFTKACGRCLVSAAQRDGMTLVAVTLNAPDDWNDHKALLDMGFSSLERVELIREGESAFIVPCIGTEKGDVIIKSREGLTLILPKKERNIKRRVILPQYMWAPVIKDSVVGKIEFYDGEEILGSVPLYAEETVERVHYRKSILERIIN